MFIIDSIEKRMMIIFIVVDLMFSTILNEKNN